jgi:hypothetical protein
MLNNLLIRPHPFCNAKYFLSKGMASPKGDKLLVFYYLSASGIWLLVRGAL